MSTSNSSTGGSQNWLTGKRLICLGLIVAATLYVLLQPKLEQWTGLDLPDIVQDDVAKEEDRQQGDSDGEFQMDSATLEKGKGRGESAKGPDTAGFPLKEVGRNSFESPEGLLYTPGKREHRIEHVMRHARDNPGRDGPHGVFDGNTQEEVLAVLDEAYKMIKSNASGVRKNGPDDLNRYSYTVDMPKRIGFVGGQAGARQNRPGTRRLKLVLDGNRVITAYPTWPSRRRGG